MVVGLLTMDLKKYFQVVSGGNLDVDVIVEGPNRELIYRKKHEEYDTTQFKTNVSNCFSIQLPFFFVVCE